jgi:hypothetical protein
MALESHQWFPSSPERDVAVQALIHKDLAKIRDLAEQLHDDELAALLIELMRFHETYLTPRRLQGIAEHLEEIRIRKAPEPAGADWACESPDRAAAVVEACRLVHKRMTGPVPKDALPHYLRFAGMIANLTDASVNQFTLRAWRRREAPVDRGIVGAALKLARIENARELTLRT